VAVSFHAPIVIPVHQHERRRAQAGTLTFLATRCAGQKKQNQNLSENQNPEIQN